MSRILLLGRRVYPVFEPIFLDLGLCTPPLPQGGKHWRKPTGKGVGRNFFPSCGLLSLSDYSHPFFAQHFIPAVAFESVSTLSNAHRNCFHMHLDTSPAADRRCLVWNVETPDARLSSSEYKASTPPFLHPAPQSQSIASWGASPVLCLILAFTSR